MVTDIFLKNRKDSGFAVLEAMVALLVIALAAAVVPVVTLNAKRRMMFNKRRYGILMARDQLIRILSNDSIWNASKTNFAGNPNFGANYIGTGGGNMAIYSNFRLPLIPPILNTGTSSCGSTYNGWLDNGQWCCDVSSPGTGPNAGYYYPTAACPIMVNFAVYPLCSSCSPALVNLQAIFSIYMGDITDSTLNKVLTDQVQSGNTTINPNKYEIDLIRFFP